MSTRMAARAAVNTANNDGEMNDGMAEIELQRLQRQYRIMEGDRKAYSEESRILLTKQRATIEKLKKDNEHLREELRLLEERTEDQRKNGINSKKAAAMSEQAETLQRKIRQITSFITELNAKITSTNNEIDAERSKLGGVHAARLNTDSVEKQVRVLENRLDKALVKFNKALAVNKRLRAVIDNLRRERLVFDNIYHKFEKDLLEQKKQMADIIETSNAAYEARDEAQTKIIALREKAEKEYQAYIQETKELDRVLEQDRRLKEFMAAKISDRSERVEGAQLGDKKGEKEMLGNKFPSQEFIADSLSTYENAFTEIRKVTGISDITELVQRFKAVEDQNFSLFNYVNEINNEVELHAEEIVEIQKKIDAMKVETVKAEEERKKTMRHLEDALDSCKEKTGKFESQYENIRFTLSDLEKGIEHLIQTCQSIVKQIPQSQEKNATTAPESVSNAPTTGEQPETATASESGPSEAAPKSSPGSASSATATNRKLDRLRALIEFPLPTDTIGSVGVNESNLIQFLGIVEQKTNELLALNHLFSSPKKLAALLSGQESAGGPMNALATFANGGPNAPQEPENILSSLIPSGGIAGLLGPGPTAPIGQLSIIPPSTGDEHENGDAASDEEDRPLTREELRNKTLRGIQRREKSSAAGVTQQVVQKGKRKTGGKKSAGMNHSGGNSNAE